MFSVIEMATRHPALRVERSRRQCDGPGCRAAAAAPRSAIRRGAQPLAKQTDFRFSLFFFVLERTQERVTTATAVAAAAAAAAPAA